MGLIYKGLPIDLIKKIASQYKLDFFVETGTFLGFSLAEAGKIFASCYSIEIAEEYYLKAKERFDNAEGIHLLMGSSAEKIKEIDYSETSAALFWLDAHYSGGITGGKNNCPLLEEIKYIASLPIDKYIFIDDARFVLSPYQGERYCEIEQLFSILPGDNYNVIINDIIISVPIKARKDINDYCLKHTQSTNRKIRSRRVRKIVKQMVGDL